MYFFLFFYVFPFFPFFFFPKIINQLSVLHSPLFLSFYPSPSSVEVVISSTNISCLAFYFGNFNSNIQLIRIKKTPQKAKISTGRLAGAPVKFFRGFTKISHITQIKRAPVLLISSLFERNFLGFSSMRNK